jgi:hypothetical protein
MAEKVDGWWRISVSSTNRLYPVWEMGYEISHMYQLVSEEQFLISTKKKRRSSEQTRSFVAFSFAPHDGFTTTNSLKHVKASKHISDRLAINITDVIDLQSNQ